MSKTAATILWIVVAVIVIGGIWWWMMPRGAAPGGNGAAQSTGAPAAAGTATTSASAQNQLPSGNSDQAIGQEMTNIDAQMNGLNTDSANVNQSMSDQPVQQAQ